MSGCFELRVLVLKFQIMFKPLISIDVKTLEILEKERVRTSRPGKWRVILIGRMFIHK